MSLKSFIHRQWDFIFRHQGAPKWLRVLNYAGLSGIIVWPLVFFTSIFLFDNPKNLRATYLIFFLLNAYPLGLLLLSWASFSIYRRSTIIAAALPLLVLLFYGYVLLMVFGSGG